MKRLLNKTSLGAIGNVACIGMCLINLTYTIYTLVLGYLSDPEHINTLILPCISGFITVIFYFIVSGYFLKSKKNFGFAFNAMFILLLSDYILPFVFNMFDGLIFDPLNIINFVFGSVLSSGVGIAYFVMIILENKYRGTKKTFNIVMLVLGSLLACFALISMITSIIINVNSIISGSDTGLCIISIILSFFSFLVTSLYLFYPIFLKRFRERGF